MKRSQPIKRTPLRPGQKGMKRAAQIKVRKVSRRFAVRRNPMFTQWIRENFPCAVPGCENRPVDCAHLKSRGAGGDDVGNCIALCRKHHNAQHAMGIFSFQDNYKLGNLFELAAILGERYRKECP